jgi:uncharacterized membrane protein
MNSIPLHPLVVHVPIALAVLMPLIAAGLLLAWWRDALPRRAWWVAVALQGILLVSSVAALKTGEAEEERVEEVVPEAALEEHEEAALPFVIGSGVVLLLFLAAGLFPNETNAKRLALAATFGTLAVLYLGYRVGEAGGELVYEHDAASAYGDAASAYGGAASGSPTPPARDDDDD